MGVLHGKDHPGMSLFLGIGTALLNQTVRICHSPRCLNSSIARDGRPKGVLRRIVIAAHMVPSFSSATVCKAFPDSDIGHKT